MSHEKCIKCGRDNPEYTLDFITVHQTTTKSYERKGKVEITTKTTREAIAGSFHGSVCEKCIRKNRLLLSSVLSPIVLGIVFVVVFVGTIFIGGNEFSNKHMGGILIAAAASGIIFGALCFIFLMRSFEPKDLAGGVIKDAKKTPDLVYVLVDREYYKNNPKISPTLYSFKMKTGLKTEVADILFNIICGDDDHEKILQEAMEIEASEKQS